jgi:hypothetical protein
MAVQAQIKGGDNQQYLPKKVNGLLFVLMITMCNGIFKPYYKIELNSFYRR